MTIFEECLGDSTDCAFVPNPQKKLPEFLTEMTLAFQTNRQKESLHFVIQTKKSGILIKFWNHTMRIYVKTANQLIFKDEHKFGGRRSCYLHSVLLSEL